MAKIIAIANQKGGVGKTTTAVNLSAALAARGKHVLLADLDPQGNATSGLGITAKEGATIYEALIGEKEAALAIVSTETEGLDILPTGIALAGAEIELIDFEARETLLKQAIEPLRARYDFIIIDCPPSLSLLTINALTAADSVLIPMQCEYFAMEGLGQLMNTVTLMRRKLNPGLKVEGILMTMYDSRTNLSTQVVSEVRRHFKSDVFKTTIPRNVRLSEAPSYGQPILSYDPRCSGAKAYVELAKEIIRRK